MKKIFIIIASSLTLIILGLLVITNFIFIKSSVISKSPNTINIYKKSIASLNNKSYKPEDSEFNDIIKFVDELGKISTFERLVNRIRLDGKIIQSKDGEYSSSIADVRNSNICVEFIYEAKQDKIVYIEGETKVVSFNKITYVLSSNYIDDIIIYYAEGNNGYDNYDPLIMSGKSEKLINYINSL